MQYLSTRGGPERLSFEEAVLRGLAPNGGLYIPSTMPTLPSNWASEWASLSFPEISHKVLSLFIPSDAANGGIPSSELQTLINKSYSTFRHDLTTPLQKTRQGEYILELWHGPTFAFKDVALQFLGNLFEYFLARRNASLPADAKERHRLTVLGATSGDTGSAAIAGLRSKKDVEIFILHPKGRVSPIQEAQMTTVLDKNVHNLAVEGSFDDCQDIVKALFSEPEFNAKHHLGAINSINFARILAQIVYYFSAYFQLCKSLSVEPTSPDAANVQFVVPTGNFGDILAGYYAKRLGLPIKGGLVVATNENDILERFWSSGRYEKASSEGQDVEVDVQTAPAAGSSDGAQAQSQALAQTVGGVKQTLSPAMDILVSSNFERLLWYIAYETSGSDQSKAGEQVKQWMDELKSKGKMEVSPEQLKVAQRDFQAKRVSDEQIRETILRYFAPSSSAGRSSYLLDPHTAVGVQAANWLNEASSSSSSKPNQVVLATAHPAKFAEAVTSSLSSSGVSFDFEKDVLPVEMRGLLEKERRVEDVKVADGGDASGSEEERLQCLIRATAKVLDREAEKQGVVSGSAGKGTESI
ncbi:tryptophan synthase beta subunit-like PLP-dependent enzyme [Microstroma glucosiphilum]|uniref:threonine synthase n=1 Tax=Pseudomicrostroma glucosiphilum TaxID=1684307 RepID=A0A316U8R9_9BASI|nr:tryptophan synthase beta subunit-like PLP-dependent enzyme [Pseudomicrostroma glucosiphilum]PWN21616.1 tryptophan synthase beta subunit-like PLP-dependent enzyme [Pseudomicrostroma glucosiphilum]